MYVTWPLVDSVIHTKLILDFLFLSLAKELHLEITLKHFSAGHAEFRSYAELLVNIRIAMYVCFQRFASLLQLNY